jgi:hypothetical protein
METYTNTDLKRVVDVGQHLVALHDASGDATDDSAVGVGPPGPAANHPPPILRHMQRKGGGTGRQVLCCTVHMYCVPTQ